MARRKVTMKKLREIIRLKEECKLSQRGIARALNISRPVVNQYIKDICRLGLEYTEIKDMPDDTLIELISRKKSTNNEKYKYLETKFEKYVQELKLPGVTKQLLWEEYIRDNPGGYSYSQFCYHFQVWQNTSEITMHIEHKAGDKLFVDFTGKKLSIKDRKTGELQELEVFVGVLGGSHLTYVEAVKSQKKADWIRVNENALRYFGGVPRAIVPDCLKSGVTKGDKYEPDINPEYYDFARHYGTTILPARPYSPRDKAIVEGAVRIVYSWIFAPLRNQEFGSIEELNTAIRSKLEEYNNRQMQRLNVSRRELFEKIEAPLLQQLPVEKYEIRHFKKLKVQFNYHVYLSDDTHYYSVPYRFRGKRVEVIYTGSSVEIYHNNTRIAIHKREYKKYGYTTLKEHMPENHKWKDDWNPDKILSWAEAKGESVKAVIEAILSIKQHPEQGYKSCLGILNLAKEHGEEKLNQACHRALLYQGYSYKMISNILKHGLENIQEELDYYSQKLPSHENIRGSNYYN
jgi:transposase